MLNRDSVFGNSEARHIGGHTEGAGHFGSWERGDLRLWMQRRPIFFRFVDEKVGRQNHQLLHNLLPGVLVHDGMNRKPDGAAAAAVFPKETKPLGYFVHHLDGVICYSFGSFCLR